MPSLKREKGDRERKQGHVQKSMNAPTIAAIGSKTNIGTNVTDPDVPSFIRTRNSPFLD